MEKTSDKTWNFAESKQECPEVSLSWRLATLAKEAAVTGFPFTAEHLRRLAGCVLDEAAVKYNDLQLDSEDSGPSAA
jgi:hypothetical protein